MQMWACGHSGQEGRSRLCPHLVGADLEEIAYHRVLRGRGLEYDMCCDACAQDIKSGASAEWLSVCEACVETLEENDWNALQWIGEPGIGERQIPFGSILLEHSLPKEIANALCVAPLNTGRFVGYWNETLYLIDKDAVTDICGVSLPREEDSAWCDYHLAPRICLSSDGRFLALCHDYGRFGQVLDLHQARATLSLNRGAYHPETQPFPAAFIEKDGSTFLVHAVDWNRLEVSDPQTGEILTARGSLVFKGRTRPEHYLDYFHGSLLVSPNETAIADDGWAWHPVGAVVTWNLKKWLDTNSYESEDGESRRTLCCRDYLWNVPMAWIDDSHLAVWGIGRDDEAMLSGARVFDVETGKETAAFAGPSRNAFFGGEGRLFSVEEDGLHIWNARTGERVGSINGFKPRWQRGDFLVELDGNRVRSWNWRAAFD